MKKNICEFLESCDDFTHSGHTTIEEIREAEKQLNLKFADDYVECLLKYNCVSVEDVEIMGITDFKACSVVYETISEKESEGHAYIKDEMYLISNIGFDDILAWQDHSGTVYLSEPFRRPVKVADSLAEYIYKALDNTALEVLDDLYASGDYEEDINDVIDKLDKWRAYRGASYEDVKEAEYDLDLKFNEEYKTYLFYRSPVCGGGIELTGVTNVDRLNVVLVTERERMRNPLIKDNMYVVEVVGIDGIVILQDETGVIYAAQPYVAPKKIFNSLKEYVENVGRFYPNENARMEFAYNSCDEFRQDLLERMENGVIPISKNGTIFHLHHMGLASEKPFDDLPLIEMSEEEYYDPKTTMILFRGLEHRRDYDIVESIKQKQIHWNLRSSRY